ncbi:hypothetical protein DAPPUDRAFT_315335 [Daphnia pulex]|uniref:Uncharacterized protein n=1 Tax=Daphnia pulex TaxID=6669 RepID=E9G9F9_DAPPU|nr:hypothetical protein DAPPUDRAFT_315335 [Daphnia pulex]|eukprot:EFX83553.1 hypothetical protein DAPPUDRAFT_315335 [Daphnia pulex]
MFNPFPADELQQTIDPMEELFQGTYYGAKILVRKQVEINMTQKFTASDIRTSTLQTCRESAKNGYCHLGSKETWDPKELSG